MIFNSKEILKELFVNKDEELHIFDRRTIDGNIYYLYVDKCCSEYYCQFMINDKRIAADFFKLTTLKSIDEMQLKFDKKFSENVRYIENDCTEQINFLKEKMEKANKEFLTYVCDFEKGNK